VARLMGLDPRLIAYLNDADGLQGPIVAPRISQRGEALSSRIQRFAPLKFQAVAVHGLERFTS
jgi:hypothetical protein